MSTPTFSPVDHDTACMLELLASTEASIPEPERQWQHFLKVLEHVAGQREGLIDQNATRPMLRGEVSPSRIGPFFRRACREGRIQPNGYTTSNDKHGRNAGRPAQRYRWLAA